jgi:hypothetical protein
MSEKFASLWKKDSVYLCFLLWILSLGLAIRLVGLNRGIWLDEYTSVFFSQSNLETLFKRNFHFPAYFLLLKAWGIFGKSEAYLRIPSVLFGTGSILMVMILAKRFSRSASLIAGILALSLPFFLNYSNEIRHYGMLVFLTSTAFYFSDKFIRTDAIRYLLGAILALLISLATHAIGIFLFFSLASYLIACAPKKARLWGHTFFRLVRQYPYRIAALLTLLVSAPAAYLILRESAVIIDPASWWIPKTNWGTLWGIFGELAGKGSLEQLTHYYFPKSDTGKHWGIILIALNLLFSLFGNWRLSFPFLIASIVFWGQLIFVSFYVIPITGERIFLPGLIPFIIFIAIQISTISLQWLKYLAISSITLLSLLLSLHWVTISSRLPREPWKAMASFIAEKADANDLFLFNPLGTYGPFSFYLKLLRENCILIDSQKEEKSIQSVEDKLSERKEATRLFFITRPQPMFNENLDRAVRARIKSAFPHEKEIFFGYLTAYSVNPIPD